MARSGVAFDALAALPKSAVILWKLAAEACLLFAVVITAQSKTALKLAAYVGLIVIADVILAFGAVSFAGLLFALAHLYAAFIYTASSITSKPRARINIIALLPLMAVLGIVLNLALTSRFQILALFPVFSAIAAFGALRSPYPKLYVGLGAVILWLSDMVFVLAMIFTGGATSVGWLVWLSFSTGLLFITLGFIKHHSIPVIESTK
ncbi:MAG: hypothetical protein ABJ275_10930 [Maricaulaceae bacterium]